MLIIRLTRRGKRNKAFFRVVVAEHTAPIKGRFLESLGFFNPHTKERKFSSERIKHWLKKGAQCSDTAHNLFVAEGIIEEPKRPVKIRKKSKEDEKEDAPEKKKKEESAVEKKEGAAKATEEKAEKEEAKKDEEPKKESKEAKGDIENTKKEAK